MTAEEAAEAAHRLSELSRMDEINQFERRWTGLFASPGRRRNCRNACRVERYLSEKLQNIEEA